MSDSGPDFYAWCDDADRADAFAAAIVATSSQPDLRLQIRSIDPPYETWSGPVSVGDLLSVLRPRYCAGTYARAGTAVVLKSGRVIGVDYSCFGEGYERRHPSGPLSASLDDRASFLGLRLRIPTSPPLRSREVEAAMVGIQCQQDIEDLMVRLCTPDAKARVTTGICAGLGGWSPPVEGCASYHADAMSVGRDLALSWVHIHDGDRLERAASLSISELRDRVESSPAGARVAVARTLHRAFEHILREHEWAASRETRHGPTPLNRRGAPVILSGDAELAREAVIAALSAPPGALLEALEASASVPDDEWRAVEPLALEAIEAAKTGTSAYEVDATTRKHVRFLEQHAPYHVRRLPNGGVMLSTHPYRTLWSLYADALFLLGLRKRDDDIP